MANDLTPMTRRYPTASEEELRYRWCALLYGEELAAGYIAAWRAHRCAATSAEASVG
jgi:hypothetical protein